MATIKSRRFGDIYFVKGTVHDSDTIYPIMDTLKVPLDGIKFYGNVFLRITQLTNCAISLYHWFVMEMTDSMIVSTDNYQRKRFLEYCDKLSMSYHDMTVKRAIAELVNMELLIRMDRGRCKVNPEFCYRGKEQERKVHMKLVKTNTAENKKYTINVSGETIKKK